MHLFDFFFFFFSSQDQEQSTPLHAAAYLGDVHIMDLLINSGSLPLKCSRIQKKHIDTSKLSFQE